MNRIRDRYLSTVSKFIKNKVYLNTYAALTDNSHMEIENCRRILEYNDICIRLRTENLIISIWGENLSVSDYNTDGIVIDGVFSSVEFEKAGG